MDDKLTRDRRGEIFQDELTENQSMPRPSRREDAEESTELDSQVDSQEADRAMAEDRFGQNQDKREHEQRDER
ncbi:MAG TPA: hypothetical protein VFN37_12920 [Candidatus Baltobacteraceae bacterium]|nr:hypothetical protein [Candidatus Baltobacteraceae bacterium]